MIENFQRQNFRENMKVSARKSNIKKYS